MKNIVITSATRTAVGSLNRSLKNVQGYELGSAVIRESIVRSKIKKEEVDEVIFGQVLTGGAKILLDRPLFTLAYQRRSLLILLIKFVVRV